MTAVGESHLNRIRRPPASGIRTLNARRHCHAKLHAIADGQATDALASQQGPTSSRVISRGPFGRGTACHHHESFQTFLYLVNKARNVYGQDSRAKYRTRTTHVPLQLLVLCSLRILGRGSSPHDDADHTSISSNTIRLFFHRFCAAIVKHESAEWLSAPTTEPEIRRAVALYAQEGFVGCLGSTDGVHVSYDRCPAALRSCMVGKEGIPTVAYEVTVRHDRWIMHATRGFPGSWNDKSMSRYDSFLGKVRDVDGLYANIEFTVHTTLTETATVRGLCLIVDGGFHQWRCLQCPFREASDKWGSAWTEKLMSLRKDVECTFGILKKRFRILKIPQLWTADHHESPTLNLKLDNVPVFHTCCVECQEPVYLLQSREYFLPRCFITTKGVEFFADFELHSRARHLAIDMLALKVDQVGCKFGCHWQWSGRLRGRALMDHKDILMLASIRNLRDGG